MEDKQLFIKRNQELLDKVRSKGLHVHSEGLSGSCETSSGFRFCTAYATSTTTHQIFMVLVTVTQVMT